MKGVIGKAMQDDGDMDAPGVAEGSPEDKDESQDGFPPVEGANAEDTEKITLSAEDAIYDEEITPHILQVLNARKSKPELALGDALVFVMAGLREKSNGPFPPKSAIQAAQEILPQLAEIAKAAGIFTATPQQVRNALVYAGMKTKEMYSDQQGQQAQPGQPPGQQGQPPSPNAPPPNQPQQPPAPMGQPQPMAG